jgi:hypothetical protein
MVVKSMSVFGSMKIMADVAAHWGVPASGKNIYPHPRFWYPIT